MPNERISITVFIAVLIHAGVLLGLNFTAKPKTHTTSSSTMEVTLAYQPSLEKSDKPDFLANANQTGSGTEKTKKTPSLNKQAPVKNTQIRKAILPSKPVKKNPAEKTHKQPVVSKKMTKPKATIQKRSPSRQSKDQPIVADDLHIASQMASLQTQFAKQSQAYARLPRVHRITAASSAFDVAAYYKDSWQRKVERVGNLNYPEKARAQKLYGQLRLLVAINTDGSLFEVKILQSSGSKVLDNAAISIVRLASPYAPFTGEIKQKFDRLEIIRTWRFEKSDSLSSY